MDISNLLMGQPHFYNIWGCVKRVKIILLPSFTGITKQDMKDEKAYLCVCTYIYIYVLYILYIILFSSGDSTAGILVAPPMMFGCPNNYSIDIHI